MGGVEVVVQSRDLKGEQRLAIIQIQSTLGFLRNSLQLVKWQ